MKEKLCICLPGHDFSYMWLASFCDMISRLQERFQIIYLFSQGCNLFDVRNGFINHLRNFKPDYILWIDSDNQVSIEGFNKLHEFISSHPECDAIGGWYLMNTMMKGNLIAAGWDDNSRPDALELHTKTEPFEVDYIGFGFLLMRMSAIDAFDRNDVFRPRFDPIRNGFHGDDVSFCYEAVFDKGMKFYLHPQVQVPHLKLMPLPIIKFMPKPLVGIEEEFAVPV